MSNEKLIPWPGADDLFSPGNVKSCLPDVLQLVSTEQGQTGRGGAGRYHTATDARDRVKFSSQAIRPPHPLRPRQRGQELQDAVTTTRWSCDVHQASHGSLLPSQRTRVDFIMVRTLVSGQPRSIDTYRRVSGFKKKQHA